MIQVLSSLIFVALPFLNILRLDVPTLRFYFFNSALWIDEFYLLFLVAMLLMWVIVIVSMLYGRVWCGWMCPQTILDELHRWFTAAARRFFLVPRQGGAWWRRAAADAVVAIAAAVVSLLIGFILVAYFVDPYRMFAEAAAFALGPVTSGITAGIAALLFVDVMFWREKFCTKACPYGMFQFVVTDANTQVVRFHAERSDDCIACEACVRDCMMGIDIRTSPHQTECIHCGDCVDSCGAILGRLRTPLPTLISFSWGERDAPKATWYGKLGFVDAKRWAILGLTALYAVVLGVVVGRHQPLSLSASGDRSTLYHVADDGRIYNEYALKVSNRSVRDGWFRIGCGEDRLSGTSCSVVLAENPLYLRSREEKRVKLLIYTRGESLRPGPNTIGLSAVNTSNESIRVDEEIVFFMPEPHPTTNLPAGGL